MQISASLQGVDRLIDAVRVAPDAVHEVMDVATLEAGEIVAQEAREKHRYQSRTAAIERSVTVRRAGQATASVFLDPVVAKYGPMLHEGTRAHLILPVHRQTLRWSSGDRFLFARKVRHPGTKPDPFLYEAADRKNGEVIARLQEGVWDGIKEAGLA